MPLLKSKFKKDVKKDMPEAKNLAVAYGVKRNAKKPSDMRHEGIAHPKDGAPARQSLKIAAHEMAIGGGMKSDSVADEILKRKKMAKGGMLEDSSEETGNVEDDLNFEALRKESYSEHAALEELDTPDDFNLHGDELEDADMRGMSMIDKLRRKSKMMK